MVNISIKEGKNYIYDLLDVGRETTFTISSDTNTA